LATDATHAYRGYRLQALYTLHQILHTQENNKLIFQPEGNEDLSVYDENLNLLEEIQIKAYSAPLTLSNFEPSKPLSFFNRMVPQVKSVNMVLSLKKTLLICFRNYPSKEWTKRNYLKRFLLS
jgi:hypothetical protein